MLLRLYGRYRVLSANHTSISINLQFRFKRSAPEDLASLLYLAGKQLCIPSQAFKKRTSEAQKLVLHQDCLFLWDHSTLRWSPYAPRGQLRRLQKYVLKPAYSHLTCLNRSDYLSSQPLADIYCELDEEIAEDSLPLTSRRTCKT